ncbi:MAG: hypothetical protein PWQ96_325 [Clostridia bacterium]|jgi:hypothetical protein|nr:hypothetical protein [Clostridia bacterium]
MISISVGKVVEILNREDDVTKILVELGGKKEKAINYNKITGEINEGDKVLLNITAVKLGLGTGGYHFVMANYSCQKKIYSGPGHLMKLRYTPCQLCTLSVEEEESPYREKIINFKDLRRMPILIGSLHSQLPAAIAGILSVKDIKPVYIMTDGGALPISFSRVVSFLKRNGFLAGTITIGHSFGGDLEAVNIYTGLIAAKEVLNAKISIVLMGPGILGSGTQYGFTGIEQGEIINSVAILGGTPIAIPRISFADSRNRHYGLSHHTITALGKVALKQALLPVPKLEEEKANILYSQLQEGGLADKHRIIEKDATKALQLAKKLNFPLSTMGREIDEDYEYFLAAAAAGIAAVELVH